jgi:hypothetical protein
VVAVRVVGIPWVPKKAAPRHELVRFLLGRMLAWGKDTGQASQPTSAVDPIQVQSPITSQSTWAPFQAVGR